METAVDYGEIDVVLKQIWGNGVSFSQMVEQMTSGGRLFSGTKWAALLINALTEQLQQNAKTIGYLILLIISAAVLAVAAKAFQSRQISDMGFYMVILLLYVILMKSFGICYELTQTVLDNLTEFMKMLMPAYLLATAASAYQTSAVIYYECFLLMIYYLQKLTVYFLLPGIRLYVILVMLGHLGTENVLEKGKEGLKKLILWSMKALIGVGTGLQLIQGMVTPAVDEVKHTMLSKGISSLGGIGNVARNVTDVIIGSGTLLRNGIGAAAAVALVMICMLPAVQTAGYAVFYQVLAAVTEPVSDKRITKILVDMGEGIGLLVKLLFTVCALFLLTIAIVCATTGGLG